jgi:hypothetical protein
VTLNLFQIIPFSPVLGAADNAIPVDLTEDLISLSELPKHENTLGSVRSSNSKRKCVEQVSEDIEKHVDSDLLTLLKCEIKEERETSSSTLITSGPYRQSAQLNRNTTATATVVDDVIDLISDDEVEEVESSQVQAVGQKRKIISPVDLSTHSDDDEMNNEE